MEPLTLSLNRAEETKNANRYEESAGDRHRGSPNRRRNATEEPWGYSKESASLSQDC